MRTLLKKTGLIVLSLLIVFLLVSCKEDDILIEIEVTRELYVNETADYSVIQFPDDIKLQEYEFSSTDEDILKVNETTIEGISAGKAEMIIVVIINEEKIIVNTEIEVKENLKQPSIVCNLTNDLSIGGQSKLQVVNEYTGDEISDYNVFIDDTTILKYQNLELYGLKAGVTTVTITSVIDGFTASYELQVEVYDNTLEVNFSNDIYKNQIIDVIITLMPENITLDDYTLISSNENVLDYEESGKFLYAASEGKSVVTILAVYEEKEYRKVLEVNVIHELTLKIEIANEITTKEPVEFKVFVMPDNVEVTDFSSFSTNKNVLTTNKNIVIPLTAGNAKLSVSCIYNEVNLSAVIDVNVKTYIPEYLTTNIPDIIFINEVIDLEVKINPNTQILSDYAVVIDDSNILEYNNGKLIAKAEGNAKVVISKADVSIEKNIIVTSITGIRLEIDNDIIENEVVSYKVYVEPANLEFDNFTYESSDDCILINNNAIFSKTSGSSNIIVKYNYLGVDIIDQVIVTAEKNVYPIERIYLIGSKRILQGSSNTLVVKKYPSIGTGEISLTVDNENVAKIIDGELFGVSLGTCIVTAKVVTNETIFYKLSVEVVAVKELSATDEAIYNNSPMLARYYEDKIIRYNELSNGVTQTTYIGYTSTQLPGDVDGYTGLTGDIVLDQYYQQQVNILEVPSSENIKVIPWANLAGHRWTLTTVKKLIEDYELNNPGYKVIAAVNGDFFDINGTGNLPYQTVGENISNGEFYKTSNGFGPNGGTIGFTNDGSANSLVSAVDAVRTSYMILAIYDENNNIIKEFNVEKINSVPDSNQTSVYYGTYNGNKKYVPIDTPEENVWVVENAELALPNNEFDFYGKGVVTSTNQTTLQKGQFAISTNNSSLKEELNNALQNGLKIRVQYEFTGEFENVTSATGYNGIIFDETHDIEYTDGNLLSRAPRTVIGMKEDGTLVMMVVDGRQGADNMYGCDGYEVAAIMQAHGCVKAYNLDGGGSTTMIIRTSSGLEVLNSPSDGSERNDGNCVLICTYDPDYKVEVNNITENSAEISVTNENVDYQNLPIYVSIEDVLYKCENGVVKLENLVHNTIYNYQVYYEINGIIKPSLTMGLFTSGKDYFKYLGLVITDNGDSYTFTTYEEDVDDASNVEKMVLILNGNYFYMDKYTITINKNRLGESQSIESIVLNYYYYDGSVKYDVVDENPLYFIN